MDLSFLAHLASMGATDLHPLGRQATAALIEQLDLRPCQSVLEVGCGTGGTILRVARSGPARIDGIDLLPEMLRVARTRIRLAGLGTRSTLYLARRGAPFPLHDDVYDRVYTESVLGIHDAEGAHALLAEIYRVLAPGGRYVASEAIWRAGVPSETIAEINAACVKDFGVRMASGYPWTLTDWLQIMKAEGFRVLSAMSIPKVIAGLQPRRMERDARAILSDVLTRYYWLRGWLTPATRRARERYRRLNDRHREDGQYIEPRLFVLEKPRGPLP